MTRRPPRLRAGTLAASSLLVASCTTPATEILVSLDTDASPATAVAVRVSVARDQDAATVSPVVWRFRDGDAGLRLPASFAVLPGDGPRDGTAWISLEATFEGPAGQRFVMHRVASARFVPNATVTLSIFLNAACGAAATDCVATASEACTVAARCEERGLTCGDDARCVRPTPDLDASVPPDATPLDAAPLDAAPLDAAPLDAAPLDAPPLDAAPLDAAPLDAAPLDAPRCPGAQTLCGAVCVDTASDRGHCGACGRACPAGNTCVAGACRCVPSCGGRVCGDDGCGGACGACAAPRVCEAPAGVCACPGGTAACGTACCGAGQACIAGACRCVPSCGGRVCGDDGCGGACGACAAPYACDIATGSCACPGGTVACGSACCGGGQSCVAGQCCASTWRRELAGLVLEGAGRDASGTLLVAGRQGVPDAFVDGDRAYVTTLDACGNVTGQHSYIPAGATRANLVAVATRGAARTMSSPPVVVGFAGSGAGDIDGLFSALTTAPLGVSNSALLRTSSGDDLHWQATQTADGNLWVAGASNGSTCPSIALGAPGSTHYCSWNIFAECSANSAAFGIGIGHDGLVWATGLNAGSAFIARYPSAGCAPTPGCACAPSAAPVQFALPGHTLSTGRSLAAGPTSTYVAGYAFSSATDAAGFVAAVSADGSVTLSAPWNPSSQGDAFLGVTYTVTPSGPTLYAAGLREWNGVGHTARAVGAIAAYDATTLALRWATTVPGAGSCWNIVVDDAGGLVVTCTGLTSSTVRRCLPTGFCPS